MSKSMIGAAGGLSAADKAKLIPENLRAGLKLFEGTSKQIVGTLKPKEILSLSSGQALGSTASRVFAYMDDAEMECLTDSFNVYWYDVEKNGYCGSIPAQECEFLMQFSGTVEIQWYLIWAQNQSSTVTVKKNGEVVVNENRSIYSATGTPSGFISESGNKSISVIKGDVVSVSIGNAVAGNSVSLFKTGVSDIRHEEVDFYKNGEFEEKIAGITIPTQVSVVGFSTSNSEDGFSFSGRFNSGAGAGYVLESSGTIDVTELSKVEVIFEPIAPGASDLYTMNWVGLSATRKSGWYGAYNTVDAASIMRASLPRKVAVLDVSKLTGEKVFVVQIYGRVEQTSGIIKSIKGYKSLT